MKKTILTITLIFLTAPLAQSQTVNLSTYYPSPFGAYDRLLLSPRAELTGSCDDIGTFYVEDDTDDPDEQGLVHFCDDIDGDGTGEWVMTFGTWRRDGDDIFINRFSQMTTPRVGIGTSEPDTIFHVENDGDTRIHISSTDNDAGINLYSDDAGAVEIYSPDGTSDLRFAIGSDLMTIEIGGDVGIGITNPAHQLQVAGGNVYISNNGGKLIMQFGGNCFECGPDGGTDFTCANIRACS